MKAAHRLRPALRYKVISLALCSLIVVPHSLSPIQRTASATRMAVRAAPPLSGDEVVFDDFNDSSLDASKWVEGLKSLSPAEGAVDVQETSQELRVVPLASTAGVNYNGVRSVSPFDAASKTLAVEAVQPQVESSNYNNLGRFGWAKDSGNYFAIQVSGVQLQFIAKQAWAAEDGASVTYNATSHRWWRLRHDGTNIHYETSPDNSMWTAQHSLTPSIQMTGFYVELMSGTSQSYVSPQTARFDNVLLEAATAASQTDVSDDFNDNSVGSLWEGGLLFHSNPAAWDAVEQNGRLEITPTASSFQFDGLRTAQSYDITGGQTVTVQIAQHFNATPEATAIFQLGVDSSNRFEVLYQNGTLYMDFHQTGQALDRDMIPWVATNSEWWRFRESSGSLLFETAPNNSGQPGTWTARKTVAGVFGGGSPKWLSSSVKAGIGGGNNDPQSGSGTLAYDNFEFTASGGGGNLTDDFNGGIIGSQWTIGTLTYSDYESVADVSVTESGGLLRILPPGITSAYKHSGVYTASTVDFAGKTITVNAVQVRLRASYNYNTVFAAVKDKNNYFAFVLNYNQIEFRAVQAGSITTGTPITYVQSDHRYLMITHNASTNKILFLTSADGVEWSPPHWQAPVSIALTGFRGELSAGNIEPGGATILEARWDDFFMGNLVRSSAGPDKTTKIGLNVQLDGTASLGTGITRSWTQISGPNTTTITNATSATPTISNHVVGEYTFRQTVTSGASTHSDDVQVGVVNADGNDLIIYSDPNLEFLMGPMLMAGSTRIPSAERFERVYEREARYWAEKYPNIGPRTDPLPGSVSVGTNSTTVTCTGCNFNQWIDMDPKVDERMRSGIAVWDSAVERWDSALVAAIDPSGTSLTLTAPWPHGARTNQQWTNGFTHPGYGSHSFGIFAEASRYDFGFILYSQYLRTGLTKWRTLFRKWADSKWSSAYYRHGLGHYVGGDSPPSYYAELVGLTIRAYEGKPEMWYYLDQFAHPYINTWVTLGEGHVVLRENGTVKVMPGVRDTRTTGYALQWAAVLGKILPDSFQEYPGGTLAAPTGTNNNGAARRADYLTRARNGALNLFGHTQNADGSWRWDGSLSDTETACSITQPFMEGIAQTGLVYTYKALSDPADKAAVAEIIRKSLDYVSTTHARDVFWPPPNQHIAVRASQYFSHGGTITPPGVCPTSGGPTQHEPQNWTWDFGNGTPSGAGRYQQPFWMMPAAWYAYISGNTTYVARANEYFNSVWGNAGVDPVTGVMGDGLYSPGTQDYLSSKNKEFSEPYFTAAQYTGYRVLAGGGG